MLLVFAGIWYLVARTNIFSKYVEQSFVDETRIIPRAERAAGRERARVNEVHTVESAAVGETVGENMTREEVKAIWGDPTSVDHDALGNEIWRYEAISKKVTFRYGKVWIVESGP
ncbi:MAG: hypothetical protein ACRD16_13625 [Thermoanaerobaculia bacterium]